MTIQTTRSTQVPVAPALIAGIGAQLVDDAAFLLLPFLGPLGGIVGILLTAVAARVVTRNSSGAAVARTGLLVGGVSAGVGLLISGLGFVTIVLAGLTVLAGVVGAVAGRNVRAE